MRSVLLGFAAASLAAVTVAAAPAEAQRWSDPNFIAAASVTVHRGGPSIPDSGGFVRPRAPGDFGRDHRGRHRRDRGFDDGFFAGSWGYYDYEDRTFDPEGYNDWWHERPWRAYPAWVQHNQGCSPDRMWWGGGSWRCSW